MASAKKQRSKARASEPSAAPNPESPKPPNDDAPLPSLKLLSQRAVCELIGVTAPTLWEWARNEKFPKAIVLNGGKLGYFAHEVEAWVRSQPRQELKAPTRSRRGRNKNSDDRKENHR